MTTLAARIAVCPPLLRNFFITLTYNTAIAALLAAVGFGDGFWVNWVYSNCIGLPAWFMIDGGRRLFWGGRRSGGWIWPLAIVSMLIASFGGVWLASTLLGHPHSSGNYFTSLVITGVCGGMAVMYFWEQARREENGRLAVEAQLKLLQAQIEPHFLFNTLANLRALIPAEPARAQKMLDHLNDFLRAALAAARKERNTLGGEFTLLRGYLEILAIRLGARLRYRLDLPEPLVAVELPPMLLQPLVENAFKHGVEPRVEGGEIAVAASERGGRLLLQVRDNGMGVGAAPTAGTGAGIALVRERLAAIYGATASLEVAADPAGGVVATLDLPLRK